MTGGLTKLALGTAQFGLNYGIANQRGQITASEVATLLTRAHQAGINTLDTAIDYGESEAVLGTVDLDGWRVVSKLPALPADCNSITDWVRSQIESSLQRLGIAHLHAMLLHRPIELLGEHGRTLHTALTAARAAGLIKKIGVSVYQPEELDPLWATYGDFDLVQAPLNIFDRRLISSGWLQKLKQSGCEVHTRSAFLQGLLLMPTQQRPEKFQRWKPLWDQWEGWLSRHNASAMQTCLSFALSNNSIDRVILGVDSLSQLEQIIAAAKSSTMPLPPDTMQCDDTELLNPAMWDKL